VIALIVIPAQAGISGNTGALLLHGSPACAGVTG